MAGRFFVCEEDREESDLRLCSGSQSEKYPASSRLKRRSDFSRLSKFGRRVFCGVLSIQYSILTDRELLRVSSKPARLGITVVRKQGGSVERNLFKRRVREAFRRSKIHLKCNLDLNVRPKGRLPVSYQEIEKMFIHFESAFIP